MRAVPATILGVGLGVLVFFVAVPIVFVTSSRAGGPAIPEVLITMARGIGAVRMLTLFAVFGALAWGQPVIIRWMFDRTAGRLTREGLSRNRRSRRLGKRVTTAMFVLIAIGLLGLTLAGMWPLACLFAAKLGIDASLVCLFMGVTARRGMHVVCERCDYQMGSWRAAPERCPECGRHWKRPWAAALGHRAVSWQLLGWSAGLLIASVCLLLAVRLWIP